MAAGAQSARCLRDEAGDEIEAFGSAKQRERGLVVADLRLQGRRRPIDHVGRVRDDCVEPSIDPLHQVAVTEHDAVVHAVADGVAPGHFERFA